MTEQKLLSHLKKNPYVLAPMAGITDTVFRRLMRKLGASIVISELVSAHGLKYNSQKTKDLIYFDSSESPIGIQIFGESGQVLSEAAKIVESCGADFIDINLGCPVKKVVQKGAGAAATRDLVALGKLLAAVRAAVKIPVTIKIRTGWDEASRNAHEVVQVASGEGITWVAIHGRTRAQGYLGKSDWNLIREVKQRASIPIIGNGDISSGQMARQLFLESGCDGVMIGRGCLKDPYIFQKAQGLMPKENLLELIQCLASDLFKTFSAHYAKTQLRKFAMWFSYGFPEASAFRRDLFSVTEEAQLLRVIESYFLRVQNGNRTHLTNEAFLMGGHG